jgi:hypothetical protein
MNSDESAPPSSPDADTTIINSGAEIGWRLSSTDDLHDKILGSRAGSIVMGTITFLFLCFSIYNFMARPPIIHEELMITMPKLVNKATKVFLPAYSKKHSILKSWRV